MQRGNLLGNDADQKSQDSRDEKQGAHVGKAAANPKGIEVIRQAGKKEAGADRQKQLLRGIQRADLDDDQQEAHTIPQRANMAVADAPGRMYRHIANAEAGAEKTHGDGRRIGKTVGQQVEELAEPVRAHHAEAAGKILHRSASPSSWRIG